MITFADNIDRKGISIWECFSMCRNQKNSMLCTNIFSSTQLDDLTSPKQMLQWPCKLAQQDDLPGGGIYTLHCEAWKLANGSIHSP